MYQSSEVTPKTVNILVIGDGSVGKTSFFNSLNFGKSTNIPSNGEVKSLTLNTNHGIVQSICKISNFLDEDDEKKTSPTCDYDGCIIMFDVTKASSFKTVKVFHDQVKEKYPMIPIVVCGNKFDLKTDHLLENIGYNFEDALEYSEGISLVEMSTTINYNLCLPFARLFTKIFGGPLVGPTIFIPM